MRPFESWSSSWRGTPLWWRLVVVAAAVALLCLGVPMHLGIAMGIVAGIAAGVAARPSTRPRADEQEAVSTEEVQA